jgi:hypothetical protein
MRLISWLAPSLGLAMILGGLFWFMRDHAAFHIVAVRVYGAERVPQAELIQLAQIAGGRVCYASTSNASARRSCNTLDSGSVGAACLPQ